MMSGPGTPPKSWEDHRSSYSMWEGTEGSFQKMIKGCHKKARSLWNIQAANIWVTKVIYKPE